MGETPEAALEDLEAGLSLMKINGYNHFWSWEPAMMTKLLGLAVQRDIEKPFAVNLAKARLQQNFTEQGEPFPLLKFTLLNSFELKIQDNVLFQAKDLTPFQRELLGLLITAKVNVSLKKKYNSRSGLIAHRRMREKVLILFLPGYENSSLHSSPIPSKIISTCKKVFFVLVITISTHWILLKPPV